MGNLHKRYCEILSSNGGVLGRESALQKLVDEEVEKALEPYREVWVGDEKKALNARASKMPTGVVLLVSIRDGTPTQRYWEYKGKKYPIGTRFDITDQDNPKPLIDQS